MAEITEPVLPRAPRKEIDVEITPSERRVMLWYSDLQSRLVDFRQSEDEWKDLATQIVDLMRILEQDQDIDPAFRNTMMTQVRRLDNEFVLVRDMHKEFRPLQHSIRQKILDPRQYERAVNVVQKAALKGAPELALAHFKGILEEYLAMAKELRG